MSFLDIIKKAFPFISAAASLGGPLGTMAANAVGKALNVDASKAVTPENIESIITQAFADPAQRAALLQAEQNFQAQMAELGYKDAETMVEDANADRANARAREIAVRDWTPKVLAACVTIGFFGVLMLMGFHKTPDSAHDAWMLMLGALSTAWGGIIQYYFGSSAGSARKTELMAQNG